MKHFVVFVFTLALTLNIQAQYSTPGNFKSWSLDSLVTYSAGVVTGGPEHYSISQNLTVSSTDTIKIYENATVRVAAGCTVTVTGTMFVDPPEEVVFTAVDTSSTAGYYKGFRFENSPASVIRHTRFEFGNGNYVSYSNMIFEHCIFRKNGSSHVSGALYISQCNPLIQNNSFYSNNRSAIMSSSNANASPKIINNIFHSNGLSNNNYPHINLGAASVDTIVIINNIIDNSIAGGIALSTLVGGTIRCNIALNQIRNNRYGFTAIGNNISGNIFSNIIENNINEPNPMNGGSGLNFYSTSNTNRFIISNNIIRGNLWGITLQGQALPNLGDLSNSDTTDDGHNIIYDNDTNGVIYALYNNTPNTIKAENNFWGSVIRDSVERYIVHQPDNPSLGGVDYLPIWDTANAPSLFIDNNTIVSDTIHVGGEIENQIGLSNIGNQNLTISLKDTFGIQTEQSESVANGNNGMRKRQQTLWNTLRRIRNVEIPLSLMNAAKQNKTSKIEGNQAVIATDPANDFNGRPHNVTGLTYPDVLSINMSISTTIFTTLNCTTSYSSPIDTNIVGVISLDTDQDFMTGMYPPLANLGASNTDVGSEYEVIFTTKSSLFYQYNSLLVPAFLIKWVGDSIVPYGFTTDITRNGNNVSFTLICSSAFDDNNMNTAAGFIEVDSTFDIFNYEDYTPKHIPDAAPDLGHGRLGSEKDPSWFGFDIKKDTLIPAESDSISFFTLGTVLPGFYQATAILKSNDPGHAALKCPYHLTVLPELQPQVDLSPLMKSDTITEDSVKTFEVILHNSGLGAYKFFLADTAETPWLSVVPQMGVIPSGADLAFTISINSEGLAVGDYNANLLMISSDTLNTVVSVPVLLNVRSSVDIAGNDQQPRRFELYQNYPNPFNPSTTIRYEIGYDSRVSIIIYNLLGQEVKTLVNEFQTAGPHDVIWNGTNNQNHAVSSGNYMLKFTAGKFTRIRKIMLLK